MTDRQRRLAQTLGGIALIWTSLYLIGPFIPTNEGSVTMFHTILLWGSVLVMAGVCFLLIQTLLRSYRNLSTDDEVQESLNTHPALETLWIALPITVLVTLILATVMAIGQ